jgi:adenine deaminase
MNKISIKDFIKGIPKAELHVHIEGTFEPELMLQIAGRNKKKIKYKTISELENAYKFNNLQDFLDIYYEGAAVLCKERDFYDLTFAYLKKAKTDNVNHAEIFFDPQTHTCRGIKFDTVINGIYKALTVGKRKLGISSKLIMCFLRHLDQNDAFRTLEDALNYKDKITAVGLDSSEIGHPPSKFIKVFEKARNNGFLTVAHAGEEGPVEYIWEAIKLLKVSRIDHGNRCLEDDILVKELISRKIYLTICPLSNFKLKVVKVMKKHPLKVMLEKGLLVTINSDDPAYFGGYINQNYLAVARSLKLTKKDIHHLVRNSFLASFLDDKTKYLMLENTDKYFENN